MDKIRVLVTGANGQLGKTIQELFSKNKFRIEFTFLGKEEFDITKKEAINKFLKKKNYQYCVNCAAYTNVEQAEKTPEIAYAVNAFGVKNLAEICKKNNTILIHISTDYVFDGEKKEPYTIADKPNPINEYGKSKYQGEVHIQNTMIRYYIIRTSWLYSKKYGHNFYKTIVDKVKLVDKLIVTTEQIGCPTNTENLTKFIFNIIIKRGFSYGLYHYSDQKPMTWFVFAKEILLEKKLLSEIKLVKTEKYITFVKKPKNCILKNN